jgi:hypothetical protein
MMTIPALAVAETGFVVNATAPEADCIRVELVGTADTRAIEPLSKLLPDLHAHAAANQTALVIVDLRALEFMNSSCFKAFVSWITSVQEREHAYRITFVSNPKFYWQRRSLHALLCFAADLVSLETAVS